MGDMFPVPDAVIINGLAAAERLSPEIARRMKVRVLGQMGIIVGENEEPLEAWHRYLCARLGVPYTFPLPPRVCWAICTDPALRVWERIL